MIGLQEYQLGLPLVLLDMLDLPLLTVTLQVQLHQACQVGLLLTIVVKRVVS